jgi:inhibitor of KinA
MSDLDQYKMSALSDRSVVITLGNTISEVVNRKVLSMEAWMRNHPFPGLLDLVPAYTSLTILYDPSALQVQCRKGQAVFELVQEKLEEAWREAGDTQWVEARLVSIPVCYDAEFGPDLSEMAAIKNLSVSEIIHLHSSIEYRVYMLGFLPGFAYMGKVDEKLVTPRRSQPREVPAGSVGIAGWQTGIYPLPSPGGWQIIGRTPLKLFDEKNEPPALLAAGDRVRFDPISKEEFFSIV